MVRYTFRHSYITEGERYKVIENISISIMRFGTKISLFFTSSGYF